MKNSNEKAELKSTLNELNTTYSDLMFNKELHKYTLSVNNEVVELTSTTKHIKTYEKEYDREFNAYSVASFKSKGNAKRTGFSDNRTQKYYVNRWDLLSKEALSIGNRVHSFAELVLTYSDLLLNKIKYTKSLSLKGFDIPLDSKEHGVIDFFKWLPTKYIPILKEFKLYTIKELRAGTIDLLLYNTETNKLVIVDWKTNKRNINEVYNNKRLKGNTKYNTNFNKYSIQLRDYKLMLEESGFKVEDMLVVWLTCDDVYSHDDIQRTNNEKYSIDKESISKSIIKDDVNFKVFSVK